MVKPNLPDQKKPRTKKSKPYHIVAIGASAGGLEAMTEMLNNLSPDTGMAFVYIQHLDPTHKSMLTEILQRNTKMKVLEARDRLSIRPNHVFVIPPNKILSIIDGVLKLDERVAKPTINMSIDKFFSSLAEKQREGAIGVLLSGNANDGTYGLKQIKMAGGLTFAQDDSAKFQSMPRSAIAEDVVDLVLSPKEIALELDRISRIPAALSIADHKAEKIVVTGDSKEEEDLDNIILLLKKATSVDFSHYKISTIKRRVIRRMLIYKLDALGDYYNYLKQHTAEINILFNDVLINVTNFFRDPDSIEYMRKVMIPGLLKNRRPENPVRVWVPACATGEEAYSLAIIFTEILEEKNTGIKVQIFATDLSEYCIAKARIGLYSANELEGLSPKRLKLFFEKIDGSYRVVKSIRDMCVFANHNIFKDPPFSRLDVISCCNLMIYLDSFLQKKVMSVFHYALGNNGFLVLGKSETITTSPQLFCQIEKKYKIFSRKKETDNRTIPDLNYYVREYDRGNSNLVSSAAVKMREPRIDFEKAVDSLLLKEFVPASVVVNGNLEILQFHGSTGLFLEPLQGKASLNLLKMARPSLTYELRNAVYKSSKLKETVKKAGIELKVKGVVHEVSIEVVPVKSDYEEPLFLVVFHETPPTPNLENKKYSKDTQVKELQAELLNSKEDMRSIIEEQESIVEELQSANEEIISSNEELQSINEELETSKEEVESANEELMTINAELQLRNEQLSESYDYAKAVFETLGEAVLVLDNDYRVKTANHSFYRIFKLKEADTIGLQLFELGNRQWNISVLHEMLDEVFLHNKSFEGYEIAHDFPLEGEKVMELNARRIMQKAHNGHLIILTIRDITERKKAEKIIKEEEIRFRNMANNVPVLIWSCGVDKLCNFVNLTWLRFTGRTLEQELFQGWTEIVHPDDIGRFISAFNAGFLERKPFEIEYRLRRSDGEFRWMLNIGQPNFTHDFVFTGYVSSSSEIHDNKLAKEEMEKTVVARTSELKQAIEDLNFTNDELSQFAYAASHDLQEPLRKILTFADLLNTKHADPGHPDSEYLHKIYSSAERMRKLINDLLNFSRISRHQNKFEKVNLNQVLKGVIKDLDLMIEEKKAIVKYGELPVISGISIQLYQLFYNVIGNALKYSSVERQPVITILPEILLPARAFGLFPQHQGQEFVSIVVKDNGIGFEPEFAEQIFTIFQRLNVKDSYTGSGIGLALCRKIAIHHGGLIYAESRLDEGASFYIVLPVNSSPI